MRKLAVATVFAAMLFAPTAASGALLNIDVFDDEFDPPDASFQFLEVDNENVVWDWGGFMADTVHKHNVKQKRGLFYSGDPKRTGTYELQASVGKYPYLCEVHGDEGMKAKVRILNNFADLTEDSVRVIWAVDSTTTGNRFDARYRIDGGPWEVWRKRTRKFSKVFGANDKPVAVDFEAHEYEFSARSQKGKPAKKKRSGWSPPQGLEP